MVLGISVSDNGCRKHKGLNTEEGNEMTTTNYIFAVEQFNANRCESSIRCERLFMTEAEAMKAFDNYDVELEFRAYMFTEGRCRMEGTTLVAYVVPATIDEYGCVESDPMDEIASKEYSWDDYINED